MNNKIYKKTFCFGEFIWDNKDFMTVNVALKMWGKACKQQLMNLRWWWLQMRQPWGSKKCQLTMKLASNCRSQSLTTTCSCCHKILWKISSVKLKYLYLGKNSYCCYIYVISYLFKVRFRECFNGNKHHQDTGTCCLIYQLYIFWTVLF